MQSWELAFQPKPAAAQSPAPSMQSWEQAFYNSANPYNPNVITSYENTVNNPSAGDLITGKVQAAKEGIAENDYRVFNEGVYNDLRDAGYTGKYAEYKNWGAYDSMGGIGHEAARDLYQQALDHGKSTGDWSSMSNFMDQAQYGSRKYNRSGLFGTGLSISPLGAFGLGLGGFVAAGGLGGALGLPSGGASVTSSGNAIPALHAAKVGGSTVAGSGVGALSGQGLMGTLGGVTSAGAGTLGTTLGSAVINKGGLLSKLGALKNIGRGVSAINSITGQSQPEYSAYPQTAFNPTTITGGNPIYSPTSRNLKPVYSYSPTKYKTGLFNLDSHYRGLQ